MALKGLRQFVVFDVKAFLDGKDMICASCTPLVDFQTKEVIGTKVEALVVVDKTEYRQKEGQPTISNKYKELTFKCREKSLSIPVDAHIRPAGSVEGTIYGDYQNQLSIKCDRMEVLSSTQSSQSNQATSQSRNPQSLRRSTNG